MKTKAKPKSPAQSYDDRALAMHKKATAQEFKEIATDYAISEIETKKMKDGCIKSANACRAVGVRLQALCGHEQISFEFWQKAGCGLMLPFSFNQAKNFIAIARRLPNKVTTLEEAAPFMQLVFQSVGWLELAERDQQQNASAVGAFQKFLLVIDLVHKPYAKLLREIPMVKWKSSQIDEFLKMTGWVVAAHDQAMKLRGEEYRK